MCGASATICWPRSAGGRRRIIKRVLAGPGGAGGSVIDANTPVKFKQEGLERHLQYDRYSRKSLLDHFYDDDVSPEAIVSMQAAWNGAIFCNGAYEARIAPQPRSSASSALAVRQRLGNSTADLPKAVTLQAGSSTSGNRVFD